jgi:hypothetical protein
VVVVRLVKRLLLLLLLFLLLLWRGRGRGRRRRRRRVREEEEEEEEKEEQAEEESIVPVAAVLCVHVCGWMSWSITKSRTKWHEDTNVSHAERIKILRGGRRPAVDFVSSSVSFLFA